MKVQVSSIWKKKKLLWLVVGFEPATQEIQYKRTTLISRPLINTAERLRTCYVRKRTVTLRVAVFSLKRSRGCFVFYNEILGFQRLWVFFSAEMKGQYSRICPSLDLQTLSSTCTNLLVFCVCNFNKLRNGKLTCSVKPWVLADAARE